MEKTFYASKQLKNSTIMFLILEIVFLIIIGIFSAVIWLLAIFAIIPLIGIIQSIINVVGVNKMKLVVTDQGVYGVRTKLIGTKEFKYSFNEIESVENRNNYAVTLKPNGEKQFHMSVENVGEAINLINEKLGK